MQRIALWLVLAVAAGSSLVSCETSNETVQVFLAPSKGRCETGLCMMARDEGDSTFRLVETIGGFRFHWGYAYELEVELKRRSTFTGPVYDYVMKNVTKNDAVPTGTTFDLCMVASTIDQIDFEGNRGWLGVEQREFDFTEDLQAQIEALQVKGYGVGTFEFREDVDDPLILTRLSTDLEAPCEGPLPEYVPENPEGEAFAP
jgi:hypothetical protein